jgi:hypothetical protein
MTILGSHTLEGFGAVVDPRRRKLVAAGPYPAAAAGMTGLALAGCAAATYGFPM